MNQGTLVELHALMLYMKFQILRSFECLKVLLFKITLNEGLCQSASQTLKGLSLATPLPCFIAMCGRVLYGFINRQLTTED